MEVKEDEKKARKFDRICAEGRRQILAVDQQERHAISQQKILNAAKNFPREDQAAAAASNTDS